MHGVGEAYCVPFHPDLVARLLVDVFERYLVGEDPHDIETHLAPGVLGRLHASTRI